MKSINHPSDRELSTLIGVYPDNTSEVFLFMLSRVSAALLDSCTRTYGTVNLSLLTDTRK